MITGVFILEDHQVYGRLLVNISGIGADDLLARAKLELKFIITGVNWI